MNNEDRKKEQIHNEDESGNTYRMEWVIIPLVLLGLLSWYLTGNALAGVLAGLGMGINLRGMGKKISIRGDEYAKEVKYLRPLTLRLVALVPVLGAVYCWLTKTTYLLDFTAKHPKHNSVYAALVTVLLAGLWTGFGNWRTLNSSLKAWHADRKAKTPDEKAARRFDEDVLRRAGLTVMTEVSKEEIIPKILEKTLDNKGRGRVRVAIIPGKQTVKEYNRDSEHIASAWGVPRVKVAAGEPLKNGQHTVEITCLLEDKTVHATIPWRPTVNVKNIPNLPVADYVKSLFMGAFCESGDEWLMNLDQRNFMISGLPKFGKSSFTNALVAHLLLHPHTRVHYMDLKNGIEAKSWGNALSGVSHNGQGGVGIEGCLDFIKAAVKDLGKRYDRMAEAGVENAWTENFLGHEEPIKVLIVDECSELFKTSTPAQASQTRAIIEALKTFIQQGRAAGYILVLITQFPRTDNLPSELREIASDSIAFRVKDRGMAAALGPDFIPDNDWNDPRKSQQGEGIVVNEDFWGEKIKIAFLDKATKQKVMQYSQQKACAWLDDPGLWEEEAAHRKALHLEKEEEVKPRAVYPVPAPKKPTVTWTV